MFASRLFVGRGAVFQTASKTFSRPKPKVATPFHQYGSSQTRTQYRIEFPRGGHRRGPRYSKFDRINNLRALWYQSPIFRYGILLLGGGGVSFYVSHIETVPISGRKRFNAISAETETQMSKRMYGQIMAQYGNKVLPPHHRYSSQVQRVLDRLIPVSGLADAKWEVHVIDDPEERNAFVIPGGKVFVFSGIIPICQNDDGLAAVLGHEIAHNVAHHAAERMSQMIIAVAAMYGLAFVFGAPDILSNMILDFGFVRPNSRKQEAEADYIGLMMMAQSCYNPEAAVGLWERMEKAQKFAPPQWLSTHPTNRQRIQSIQSWLPEVENKRAESDCEGVLNYAQDFREAYQQVIW